MKKIKTFLLKPTFLLCLAAALLALSALGSAQAALTYYSENYSAQVSVGSIGVSLLENDNKISYRDYTHQGGQWNEQTGELLKGLPKEGKNDGILPGKAYPERISVENSGSIDTYVRVILYKDWTDSNGERDTSLSPELIDLALLTDQGWEIDTDASTEERTVLYYTKILTAGAKSPDLSSTLKISPDIAKKARETVTEDDRGYKTITTEYLYDGYRFGLTAEVDAVQTHNAKEAIKSAWGVDVDIAADGTLILQ